VLSSCRTASCNRACPASNCAASAQHRLCVRDYPSDDVSHMVYQRGRASSVSSFGKGYARLLPAVVQSCPSSNDGSPLSEVGAPGQETCTGNGRQFHRVPRKVAMRSHIISRLKSIALWLTGMTAVVEFLVHGKKPKPGLTILCYHRTAEGIPVHTSYDSFNVSPRTFKKQMLALRSIRGVKVVSAKTVAGLLKDSTVSPENYVLITFDDGYQNVLDAAKVLHQENYSAVIFVVTDYIGKPVFDFNTYDVWCQGLPNSEPNWYKPLSLADCQELLRLGIEIQLHGHSHRPLGSLQDDDLKEEITNSKATIERLGAGDAIALAYPYGSSRAGHFNEHVEAYLKTKG